MFKSFITFIFLTTMIIVSCKKDPILVDPRPQPVIDDSLIKNYIVKNNLTVIKHSSGLYYLIKTEGTGANPAASATVTVNYKGYLLNGNKFDGNDNITFPLSNLIQGWKIGIPLIKKGGDIKLLLPSALAYGPSGSGPIGPNEVLVFDIQLINF